MKSYERPIVKLNEEVAEGVYAASGSVADDSNGESTVVLCSKGREFASAGVDLCQNCSANNGAVVPDVQYYRKDYKGCPEDMPEKS